MGDATMDTHVELVGGIQVGLYLCTVDIFRSVALHPARGTTSTKAGTDTRDTEMNR